MLNTNILVIMKKFVSFIVLVVLGYVISFANNSVSEPKSPIVVEIKKLLESPKYDFGNQEKEAKATVLFTLNNKNEIVIIEVKSENVQVENFVKNRLNYHQLTNQSLSKGKIYKIPLKIINS